MKNIAIVGGGITGLTTALALRQLGFEANVYEKAETLNEVGAGIWLQPNALQVLDWLGLGKQIRQAGTILDSVQICNAQLRPHKAMPKNKYEIVAIHRAKLQDILVQALPSKQLHFGYGFRKYHSAPDQSIHIEFDNNKTILATSLLGADGIHSRVRKQLTNISNATRYSGQTCWRGIAKFDIPTPFTGIGRECWGKGIRFGFSQISTDTVYWFAVAKAVQGEKDNKKTIRQELLKKYQSFHPIINDIISNTPTMKILRHDLSDIKRLDSWHQNQICLLGDAAHATTPNMGQGAGQGIEDAYYFSHIWAKNPSNDLAFPNFEAARRKKVDYVVNNSWLFGKIAHHPIGRRAMPLIMKLTPETVLKKQMEDLYTLKPLTI
jgi:2-polyprenyl-6-methoxyphenol hydroxylase-like FAD-dependent oxidoreductase